MPISQERLLDLLAAGQDARAACERAADLVRSEAARAVQLPSEEHLGILRNLALMLQPDLLLARPAKTLSTLEIEAERTKPSRLRRNAREKARAARRRAQSAPALYVPEEFAHHMDEISDRIIQPIIDSLSNKIEEDSQS